MSELTVYPEMEQEEWRPIAGFGDYYEVSNFGRVRSYHARHHRRRREPVLKSTFVGSHGYLSVTLQVTPGRSSAFTVHPLVAAAFLGPRPDGLQVAHSDGDRTNARADNLRYATNVENARDRWEHGTEPVGEANGRRKLTEAQVREIYARHKEGETQVALARAFGVCQQSVCNIVNGIRWSHLRLTEVGE